MLREGARYETSVESWSNDGSGVARIDGQAVFVQGAITGERCVVEIEHIGHRAAWAHIEELLAPSPAREEPLCPHYGQCGGCQLQHMNYEMELRFKSDKITQALRRIAGLDVPPVNVHASPEPWSYRNKVQYPIGPDGQIGFYRQRTHQVIDVPRCALQPDRMWDVRGAVKTWMNAFSISPYDERTHTGLLRHLYLRKDGNGHILCVLVVNGQSVPHWEELAQALRALPNVTVEGLLLNINTADTNVVLGRETRLLWGKEYLEDVLCGVTFRLSPHSFYQVNRSQAQNLYCRLADLAQLTGEEILLDLYCGTGTIGLTLAARVKTLIGVEIVPQAVEDAEAAARRNGVANARFLCADAGQAAVQLEREGVRPDVIIVDPPRKGLSPDVVDALRRMAPPRLLYVSCDPATLARDLKDLCRDYRLTAVEGFDMFPRTHHVETLCQLDRIQN